MKQSTMFSDQFLGLAYDLLKSDHFSIQHESVIRKLVKACIEDSNKSEVPVQLADLFARFLDKQ
ncbi:TPA: hypothetical protein ACH3X1_014790 [Trebouxia sp. C0004]